jgi:hypothetical protein
MGGTTVNGNVNGYYGYTASVLDPALANATRALLTLRHPEAVYCPEGSPFPTLVSPGHYTTSSLDVNYYPGRGTVTAGNTATLRTGEVKCPMGSYCQHGMVNDCPAGRYGRAEGLASKVPCGPCLIHLSV